MRHLFLSDSFRRDSFRESYCNRKPMKRKTIPELDELDDSRSHGAPTIPAFRKPSTSIAFLPKEARRPSLFLFFLSSYSLLEHPMPTRSMTLLRASLLAAILSSASVLLVSCGEIR